MQTDGSLHPLTPEFKSHSFDTEQLLRLCKTGAVIQPTCSYCTAGM